MIYSQVTWMKVNPPRSVLIRAALSGDFQDVVTRYCAGSWERLPDLWDVPFEELVAAPRLRGLEEYVVTRPPGEGYWLRRAEQGFETFYVERGVYADVTAFSELEPAFRHWLRCHLGTYRLDVGD